MTTQTNLNKSPIEQFIPINCITEGMKLSRNVKYKEDLEILIKSGEELTKKSVSKLKNYDINGVFIIKSNTEANLKEIKSEMEEQSKKIIEDVFLFPNNNFKEKIEEMISDIIDSIGETLCIENAIHISDFDGYTYEHSLNVAILSLTLGCQLGLSKEKLKELGIAALLHDIGKVFIPVEILNKKERLTEDEFELIKKHSELGVEYLINNVSSIPKASLRAISEHHERLDGRGYPLGLKGYKINFLSKILSVADVFDALTSERPYKKGFVPSKAMDIIMSEIGTHFEYEIVSALFRTVVFYGEGSEVSLSSGDIGIVLRNNKGFASRPIIEITKTTENSEFKLGQVVDLLNDNRYMNIICK